MGIFDSMFSPNSAGLLNFGNPYGQFPEDPRRPHYAGGLAGNFPPMTDMGGSPEQAQLTPFDMLQNPATPYSNMGAFQPIPQAQMQPGTQAPPLPLPQNVGYAPGAAPQQNEAALPPGATPTQGQMSPQQTAQYFPQQAPQAQQPMPPQDNGPGFIEKLVGAMNPALGAQNTAKRNQAQMGRALYGALIQRGMEPRQAFAVAQAAATDPKMAETLLPQALGLKPPTTVEGVIADRLYKGGQGQQGGDPYAELKKLKAAEAEGTNAGKVLGETQATAQTNLPGTQADVQQTMDTIKALRNHKGRNQIGWHGFTASIPAETLRGSEAFGASKLEDRLKARTFTDQVKTMVGMGALSNAEGAKITDAVASLDRGLKREEYDKTLDFIEGALRNGIDKMSVKAGQEAPHGFRGSALKPGVYDWTPGGGMKARGQ